MKMPHLWRVDHPTRDFAALLKALTHAELQVGWLAWTPPPPTDPELEDALTNGARRAVALGEGRSVAIKRLRGAPVPKDVLREHFRGCQLVLIRGDVDLPRLSPAEESPKAERWSLTGESEPLTTTDLIRRLRRPSPHRARDLGSGWHPKPT